MAGKAKNLVNSSGYSFDWERSSSLLSIVINLLWWKLKFTPCIVFLLLTFYNH